MTKGNVIHMPGVKELPKGTPRTIKSVMDTLAISPAGIDRWKKPPFQRELRTTPKVKELAETIKQDGGVVPGIITLGKLDGETYLVDGQHRIEAFRLSELAEGYADVRICHFDSMGDMSNEFVTLNSALVRMRNEDILRGLESTNQHLATIRRRCPFVGYDHVRAGTGKVVLSMAPAIRCWFGSALPTPTNGPSSADAAKMLNEDEARRLSHVLNVCHDAWGSGPDNYRLWGTLNLALVFWLWRRIVLGEGIVRTHGGAIPLKITPDQFMKCLMSTSASAHYTAWLVGRNLRERDRTPCYKHLKSTFSPRLREMGIGRVMLPQPEWAGR